MVRLPREDGMVPVKTFVYTDKVRRSDRDPRVLGSTPVRQLRSNWNDCKLSMLPTLEGRVPT